MNFSELAPLEKFEYIIKNYDRVIDAEAFKASQKFDFRHTKEEFKSTMYFYILKGIKHFKQVEGLGIVVGINCRQAVMLHLK